MCKCFFVYLVCFFMLSICVSIVHVLGFFFFFKQKTAYEMRISDWSSDVCSSDLLRANNMSQNHCGNQAGFTVLASNRKNAPTRALRVIVDFPNESLLKILKLERLSY